MELGREAGLVAFTALPREQRGGVAKRAEVVAPVGPARDWSSRDILERVAMETPQEEADVVDPVPALGLRHLPDVHRVTRVIEGALDPAHPLYKIGCRSMRSAARMCSSIWFQPRSSKNSTAWAGQPVTSRASSSSIGSVPLRRR